MEDIQRSEKELNEMNAWRIPKLGDVMITPIGEQTVTHVTDCTWSAKMFGNIPFWEGGNWRIFKVKK